MDRRYIFDKIKENKPELSISSARVYSATLFNLGAVLGWMNPNLFITRYKDVVKHLETLTPTRQKAMCSALLAIVSDKKVSNIYKEFCLNVSVKLREEEEKQEKSPAQEEAWMSWNDIMKTYHQLEEETAPLFKKEKMSLPNVKLMRDYVILSFYVLIPPRRILDYIEFKSKNIDKEKNNYWDKDKHELVFNTYKTAKNYGQQRVHAPPELEEVFKKWYPISELFSDYVLFNGYGEKMSQPVLTKTINNIFNKKISASMLRHIYVSEVVLKDQPKLTELEKVAHDMGQSTRQQQLYKKFD